MRPRQARTPGYGPVRAGLCSRLIYGSRTALLVGFGAFVGATLGALIGVASAYFGGRIDLLTQRLMDVVMSFPLIILALAVVGALGAGTINVIVAITIPTIPRCARRAVERHLHPADAVHRSGARARGYRDWRIILRHVVPNVTAPYLIMLTALLGQAILLEASLSFLGLGVRSRRRPGA